MDANRVRIILIIMTMMLVMMIHCHHIVSSFVVVTPVLMSVGAARQRSQCSHENVFHNVPSQLAAKTATAKLKQQQGSTRLGLSEASARGASENAIDDKNFLEIPLLDVLSFMMDEGNEEEDYKILQPLPSAHLPDELATCHVYGMRLTVPLHQAIIDHAVQNTAANQQFGHLAYKIIATRSQGSSTGGSCSSGNSLVGAIGCTAQVLLNAPEENAALVVVLEENGFTGSDPQPGFLAPPRTVLTRGMHRFIVRKVLQSVPYTVALVEILNDDDNNNGSKDEFNAAAALKFMASKDKDHDDDDKDDDVYADLSPTELMQSTLLAMKAAVDQELEQTSTPVVLSPLEESILQAEIQSDGSSSGSSKASQRQMAANAARQAALENAAVLEVFQSALVDLFLTPTERYYAVAMMAAELCRLDNTVRRTMLVHTDSLQRLRYVCQQAERAAGRTRQSLASSSSSSSSSSSNIAETTTTTVEESKKDLRVGVPVLPPWARMIRKGVELEYYWNEDFGWCRGRVVDDPILVVDELIVTVYFLDDQSTHRLPFRADEKARWRPPTSDKL